MLLREKKRTIEEELGEKGEDKDTAEYREKIKKAKMPKEVEEKAEKELKRLKKFTKKQLRKNIDFIHSVIQCLSSKIKDDRKTGFSVVLLV